MRSTIWIVFIWALVWGVETKRRYHMWRERRYLAKRMKGALDFIDCVEDIDEWRNK